jgi:hypothetical protein
MPARQNEAVAVEPLRVPGIMFEKLGPESVGHGSGAHRHAGMTGVRVLDSVDRQYSDGVDAQLPVLYSASDSYMPPSQSRDHVISSRPLSLLDGTAHWLKSIRRHLHRDLVRQTVGQSVNLTKQRDECRAVL